uniref:Uncharacterized protein n=1 Tax=Nelumbo nucifera TaxID=4432 RepID=A0A822ZC02_NELNU|nr:TPA_asm: hypothetical protein HUJ06_000667 [Nelumbo nucifera]
MLKIPWSPGKAHRSKEDNLPFCNPNDTRNSSVQTLFMDRFQAGKLSHMPE